MTEAPSAAWTTSSSSASPGSARSGNSRSIVASAVVDSAPAMEGDIGELRPADGQEGEGGGEHDPRGRHQRTVAGAERADPRQEPGHRNPLRTRSAARIG